MHIRTSLWLAVLVGCGAPASHVAPKPPSGKADAYGWCHADKTVGSTDFRIDFVPDGNFPVEGTKTSWINVSDPVFDGSQSAQAVVVEQSYSYRCGTRSFCWLGQGETQVVDLAFEDGRFTGNIPNSLRRDDATTSDSPSIYLWEVAVVVDGKWYKDGDHNVALDPNAFGVCN
jgi:hypothetical protein